MDIQLNLWYLKIEEFAENLGVVMDSDFNFDSHMKTWTKLTHYAL